MAASHPLAASAGLRMLAAGGNAIDAAIATAIALTVVEPTGCGLGSDAFAIVWDGARLHGLNASGRAPAAWTPEHFAGRTTMPERGWNSVTVPGAVSAWAALSRRFGKLAFETLAAPAIDYARHGHQVAPVIAELWARQTLADQPGFADTFLPDGRAPRAGEHFRAPAIADTLEQIAATQGETFYRGPIAERLVAHAARHGGSLSLDDLGHHQPDWVDPLEIAFAGHRVHELPPNGQGIATLIALGLLERHNVSARDVDDPETLHRAIEATKLALADLHHVADPDAMRTTPAQLLDPAYLDERARLIGPAAGDPAHGAPGPGGTVTLAAADASGRMVSFIQSNFMGFGSGVVVPGGISLQNRGAGFVLTPGHPNQVAPKKRPFHTIIPGFATTATGEPALAFGLMGGPMQAQGHVQMALRVLAYGQNPQTAADAPRWRVVAGRTVAVEPAIGQTTIDALRARGHHIVVEPADLMFGFGGAQLILRTEAGYVAGSDPRKDGQAAAF